MSAESVNPLEPGGSKAVQEPTSTPQGGVRGSPLVGLAFGLVGAGLAWAVLQVFFPVFTIPEELANLPVPVPDKQFLKQVAAQDQANHLNAILLLSLFGVLVGGLLAPNPQTGRRSTWTILRNRAVGGVLGGLFGALAALVGCVAYDIHAGIRSVTPLAKTIRVQSIMFATLGAGVGLAFGSLVGWRRAVGALITGIFAGVLAGMLYPFLAGVLLPNSITETLIPVGMVNRLLWLGLAGGLLGMLIPATTLSRRPR